MIGKDVLVPYRRMFPIWKFGPVYDVITGREIGEGWSPDWFGQRRFPSRVWSR